MNVLLVAGSHHVLYEWTVLGSYPVFEILRIGPCSHPLLCEWMALGSYPVFEILRIVTGSHPVLYDWMVFGSHPVLDSVMMVVFALLVVRMVAGSNLGHFEEDLDLDEAVMLIHLGVLWINLAMLAQCFAMMAVLVAL